MATVTAAADPQRVRRARAAGRNGIEAIEVSDDHRVLRVSFLGPAPPVRPSDVRIDGGTRVTGLTVVGVHPCAPDDPDLDHELDLTVSRPGDASTYTLSLVDPDDSFDNRLSRLDFSFMAGCPSDLDCAPVPECPPPGFDEPAISYLAKDYASFRQLILDRLALIMPGWTERHIPDVGVMLVELLAYVGDYLSYYQDAVATEAYLGTARKRISVRRHVRLIDYPMHDGCNARTWVRVGVTQTVSIDPADIFFVTRLDGDPKPGLTARQLADQPDSTYLVFEPIGQAPLALSQPHNDIPFWTWGDVEAGLPAGATSATLQDRELDLHPGDVLILEQEQGHRQAVRLTRVTKSVDELAGQPVVDIEWAAADALTAPLCLSTVGGPPDCKVVTPSIAHGNVLLVDSGRSVTELIPGPAVTDVSPGCAGPGDPLDPVPVEQPADRRLSGYPVTRSSSFPLPALVGAGQSAALALIPGRVHRRMRALLRQTSNGRPLDKEQIAEIRVVYGDRAMNWPRSRRTEPATAQAAALHRLLATPGLLAKKTRWLDDLGRRARAGLLLGPDQIAEVREAWGDDYAKGLDANGNAFAGPASGALQQDPHDAAPAVQLATDPDGVVWTVRRDLLDSGPDDRDVVAETDDDGAVHLRFGDGELGRIPAPGTAFRARYRVGNGVEANVGQGTIGHLVFRTGDDPSIVQLVDNPFPAQGGTDPQPLADVRQMAPYAIRHGLRRAVTADDYATLAGRLPGIQRAVAGLRWNGSWFETAVAVDPLGTEEPDDALLEAVREGIFRYRRIGHDLVAVRARYVPLLLRLRLCALPDYPRGAVEGALRTVFGTFFAPDNQTFAADIEVSRLVALAQAVSGVSEVDFLRFERFGEGDHGELTRGCLRLGPLEIARLDNDPSRPENGQLQFVMGGGR
jgi:predicted phage baseplate assembly protein